MQIEDVELRDVFQIASIDELGGMRDGLKYLAESGELEGSPIELMLRKAHSMKGSAGMLGLKDIATLARQWEELVKQIVAGKVAISEPVIMTLEEGLDAIEMLVDEAITGNPSGVQTFYILAHLMNPERVTVSPIPDIESNIESHVELETEPGSGASDPNFVPSETVIADRATPNSSTPNSLIDPAIEPTSKPAPDPSQSHDPTQTTSAPQVLHPRSLPQIVSQQAAFIDDEELRDTFRMASADHLESLDSGLLYLEQNPQIAIGWMRCCARFTALKEIPGCWG